MGSPEMREIIIDCARIDTPRQLHETFARALSFPSWYGHNLDALHDCLTDIGEETRIILPCFRQLPGFAKGFRLVLEDAEIENDHLIIDIL